MDETRQRQAEAYGMALGWVREQYPDIGWNANVPRVPLWLIGELAGVSKSGIHQWRRRSRPDHAGKDRMREPMPAPVVPPVPSQRGGYRSAAEWDLRQVTDWLVASNRWRGLPQQQAAA